VEQEVVEQENSKEVVELGLGEKITFKFHLEKF
jgi:hypothetical protein